MMENNGTSFEESIVNNPFPDLLETGELEEEVNQYKNVEIKKINFLVIIKPAIFSLVALFISFFMDLSSVPFLGDITSRIATKIFPTAQPFNSVVEPLKFWWLPIIVYSIFIFMAYLAYTKLKIEVLKTPSNDTIDRIIASYTSIIDSISTALPLIGAALLLISVNLGRELFQGLSVPFEIKALIVLALGKLFEPVLDQLGLEFQKVATHIEGIKEKYYSRMQLENSKNLVKQLNQNTHNHNGSLTNFNVKDAEIYKSLLETSYQLSNSLVKNYTAIQNVLLEINKMEALSEDKIERLNNLANSIKLASTALSDVNVITGLKHLESIVKGNNGSLT